MRPLSAYGPDHPELEPFLYAEIGEDPRGLPLTVLSALARIGVEPRTEAERLCKLPREAAVRVMTDLIEALPDGTWKAADARSLAGGLLARLPNWKDRSSPGAAPAASGQGQGEAGAGAAAPTSPLRLALYAAVAGMALFLILNMFETPEASGDLGLAPAGQSAFSLASNDSAPSAPPVQPQV